MTNLTNEKERIEIKIQAKRKVEDERDGAMYRDSRKFEIDATRGEATNMLEELETIILEKFGNSM